MKGTYLFQKYNYQTQKVDIIQVPVEIVGESDKTYKVKLLQPGVNGHKWGDIVRVFKKNVVPEGGYPKTRQHN